MTAADDAAISLRVYFEREFSNIRRDIDTLTNTIKETAEAHAKSHDRDHHQTEQATAKAERALTVRLDQITTEAGRIDEERKRQIIEVKNEITKQGNQWSEWNGRISAVGLLIGILSLIAVFLGMWSRF